MYFQFKFIPTLITVPALFVIFGLGIWQAQRFIWKEDLTTKMQERILETPTVLPSSGLSEETNEFLTYRVEGTFDHEKEIYMVNRSLKGNPGMHVYTPLIRSDGQGVVMINRGWVEFDNHLPASRMQGQYSGKVTVTGLLRFPKGKNAFIPDNDPVKNIWFHNTLEEMADYTGYKLANYYIMSADDQVPGGFPIGNQWRMNIKNSHLQYTIIWLSLGISLLAIYLISSRKTEG